jgi:hypothetical protein|tara:strand:+ start:698 stop:1078 length:381 start_codon:yes stop_codon:yes gene_type:complete
MEIEFSISQRKGLSMEIERADKFIGRDHTTAKNVAEHLDKKYPGWLWAVHAMDGVVTVKSMLLSGNWGFVLHEDKIDNDYRAVTLAGGEILERYKQKTNGFNQERYMDLTMDNKGQLDGDFSPGTS